MTKNLNSFLPVVLVLAFFSGVQVAANSRSASEQAAYDRLLSLLGCQELMSSGSRISESLPQELVTYVPYDANYPVEALLRKTQNTQGKFLIGWEAGDSLLNFKDTVTITKLSPQDPRYDFSSELLSWSNDRNWMVRDFREVSPATSEAQIMAVRQRGVEVGALRFSDKKGITLGVMKFSDNNPYSIGIPSQVEIKDFLNGQGSQFRDRVESVELWHTHPNGNPFSLQDYIGLTLGVHSLLKELVGKNQLAYQLFVPTQLGENKYLYQMEVK
jgi:hypothetical protein